MIYVQFYDEKQSVIIACFSCPQNLSEYPNQGEIEETDPRYQAFIGNGPNSSILEQIRALESAITQRRLREAMLGVDNGWMKAQDAAITALRAQLVK